MYRVDTRVDFDVVLHMFVFALFCDCFSDLAFLDTLLHPPLCCVVLCCVVLS